MLGIGRATNQFAKLRRAIGLPPYHELNIPTDAIEAIVKSTGAEPWFVWSVQNRRTRGETNSAMDWIVKAYPKRRADIRGWLRMWRKPDLARAARLSKFSWDR
jgi:hypothetical protein